jgi:hypothetical protein
VSPEAPEVKVILRSHEDALGSAPTTEEIRALLGFEPSHLVLEKITITAERTRAPEIALAQDLGEQVVAYLKATNQEGRAARLLPKIAELKESP